jgi:hypothetical protein
MSAIERLQLELERGVKTASLRMLGMLNLRVVGRVDELRAPLLGVAAAAERLT